MSRDNLPKVYRFVSTARQPYFITPHILFGSNNKISMASPSDFSSDREAILRRQKKRTPFKFLIPIIYAPALPLIRILLRRNPVWRDRMFYGVLAGAFAHGTYLVSDLYDIESK